MSTSFSDQETLRQIFFPFAVKQEANLQRANARFVHYTTADAAISILKNKELWTRNTTCMNDYMEVRHGLSFLRKALQTHQGARFNIILDQLFPNTSKDLEKAFDFWSPNMLSETYVACFSQHLDTEDKIGRLSLWRAYAPTMGVALVLKAAPFLMPNEALEVLVSPVLYSSDQQFQDQFEAIVNNMEQNVPFLRGQDPAAVKSAALEMLVLAAVCTKHPGFIEEKEWRIIYSPTVAIKKRLTRDTVSVRGIPQIIYKIPLHDIPDEGLQGMEIPALLDRIIIGPSPYGNAVRAAFVDLLTDCGVSSPKFKVFSSDIPIRP